MLEYFKNAKKKKDKMNLEDLILIIDSDMEKKSKQKGMICTVKIGKEQHLYENIKIKNIGIKKNKNE